MLCTWLLAVAHGATPQRAAIVVGARAAAIGRQRLRFAYDDADRVADALVEVAGFERDHVHVLHDPTPGSVLSKVKALQATELALVYYSGHADDSNVYPGGAALSIRALRNAIASSDSSVRIGVLDACRGGSWTMTKGVRTIEPFAIPAVVRGLAYVAASSGDDAAIESEAVGGSLFTVHWVTGLRGPADADNDGIVTLDESFDYARRGTVLDSTILTGEAQRPSFDVRLNGRSMVDLARPGDARSRLEVEWSHGTLEVIDPTNGYLLALLPRRRRGYELALRPGRYLVRRTGDSVSVAEVQLTSGATTRIRESDLKTVTGLSPRRKGTFASLTGQLAPAALQAVGHLNVRSVGGRELPSTYNYGREEWSTRAGVVVGIHDRVSAGVAFVWGGPLRRIHLSGGVGLGGGAKHVEGLLELAIHYIDDPSGWFGRFWGEPMVLLSLRGPLTAGISWGTSGRVLATKLERGFLTDTAGGITIHWNPRLTIRVGAAIELTSFEQGPRPTAHLGLGSTVRLGVREPPLVEWHATRGISIGLHGKLYWTPAVEPQPRVSGGIGMTFATPSPAIKARKSQ